MRAFAAMIVTITSIAGCRAHSTQVQTPPSPTVVDTPPLPVIDELAYFDELTARRPDLLANDCYSTLTAKPKYRDALLHGESMAAIRARDYSAAARTHDAKWAAALQASELSFCAEHGNPGGCRVVCQTACDACSSSAMERTAGDAVAFQPSGYPLCDFVGYQVGSSHPAKSKIRDWKVFFELKDERIDALDPQTYLAFTAALARAGFHGDSKVMMGVGRVRYQYNDIIVHADSADDARIAERVGMVVFGSALASRARGLDLESTKSPDGILDWHHYLCLEGKSAIPAEGLAFVRER